MTAVRILGQSPVGAYLRFAEWAWRELGLGARPPRSRIVFRYGHLMNAVVRRTGYRRQYLGTYFLRNRPQLDLIADLIASAAAGGRGVRVAVLGCSVGAEPYSVVYAARRRAPAAGLFVTALDISPEVLAIAERGVYSADVSQIVSEPIFERMSDDEKTEMFDAEADRLTVKPWLRRIAWHLGDARDPDLVAALGPQDVVVANDFLCHMEVGEAESCLRNIALLVRPGGHLVVSGVDIDTRSRVARELGWRPVRTSLEAIHDGDYKLREGWPWRYWGLEPLDKGRRDWELRYATVFQLGDAP